MAAKLLVEIREWRFEGADLKLELELKPLTGAVTVPASQVVTVEVAHAVVTGTNFQAGLKTRIITAVQTHYGATLVADEILLR